MTEMVISVVSTRTPRKTIEVAGGESLSGEILVHEGDGGSAVLAHHGRGAKAERRSNVEVEVIAVLVIQEMIVAWVDTELAVCSTQIFLEQMTMLAFLTDDI